MLNNVFKVIFSNLVVVVAGLGSSFIFPVILSIEEYAYYQKFILLVSYINICHLGIASGMYLNYGGKLYQSINKAQYKSEIHLLFFVLTVFSLIGAGIYCISQDSLVLTITLAIAPICIDASYRTLYQAWDRFTSFSIINTIPKISILIMSIFTYYLINYLKGAFVIKFYLLTYYVIAAWLLFEFFFFTKGIRRSPIFSRDNIETTKTGFLITLGNYVGLLLHAVDKQFVSILFSTYSFAMYSFAMSTQSIMMVFITAFATPFYPKLARKEVSEAEFKILKEMLFVFGSFSGCAYFAISFIVKQFLTNYVDSLGVSGMFFAVFPAMAVINVLYINLYKVTKQLKQYIGSLLLVLGISVLFNLVAVVVHGDYVGISFATMLVYYFWLFYSQRHFESVNITAKDTVYLLVFIIIYFACIGIDSLVCGFLIYGGAIIFWNGLMYGISIKYTVTRIIRKGKNHG